MLFVIDGEKRNRERLLSSKEKGGERKAFRPVLRFSPLCLKCLKVQLSLGCGVKCFDKDFGEKERDALFSSGWLRWLVVGGIPYREIFP